MKMLTNQFEKKDTTFFILFQSLELLRTGSLVTRWLLVEVMNSLETPCGHHTTWMTMHLLIGSFILSLLLLQQQSYLVLWLNAVNSLHMCLTVFLSQVSKSACDGFTYNVLVA